MDAVYGCIFNYALGCSLGLCENSEINSIGIKNKKGKGGSEL